MDGAQLGAHLVDHFVFSLQTNKKYIVCRSCAGCYFNEVNLVKGVDELGYVLDYNKKLVKEVCKLIWAFTKKVKTVEYLCFNCLVCLILVNFKLMITQTTLPVLKY